MAEGSFGVMLAGEVERQLTLSELTPEEAAVARTIVEHAPKVSSAADMPALVTAIREMHGPDAPIESLIMKAFDAVALEEEFDDR